MSIVIVSFLFYYYGMDFSPSIVPPKEVDDPEDTKPTDWDDKEKYMIIMAL